VGLIVEVRPGWVHEDDRHVNHSLHVAVDVFDGRAEDGRRQLVFHFWPTEGTTLTAERLVAAVTSMFSTPGGRCRAQVIKHESGALGVEFKSHTTSEPGPPPECPIPVTRDAFARLLSGQNQLSN
jgi:hypothetical protein